MSRAGWLVAFGAVLAGAGGCQPAPPAARHLVLSGSPAMAPLLKEIGTRFEASRPGVRVDVQASSSDRGVADTRQGLADVGMAARPLRPDEVGLYAFPVAREGVALVVHKKNPVPTLTAEQVTGLYSRVIVNWKEAGGPDQAVALVGLTEARSLQDFFVRRFQLTATRARPDYVVATGARAVHAVAGAPPAVAYAELGPARDGVRSGQPVRLVPFDGVEPTPENFRDGKYTLTRPLNLLTREPPQGLVREFLDFAQAREVHDLLAQHSLAP
jgi:phosphate transport system substrate-binding protein